MSQGLLPYIVEAVAAGDAVTGRAGLLAARARLALFAQALPAS